MNQRLVFIMILLTLTSLYLSVPPDAEAYLDPGTGSYILQILIAGLLSALFMIKPIMNRMKLFFAKLFGKAEEKQAEESANE